MGVHLHTLNTHFSLTLLVVSNFEPIASCRETVAAHYSTQLVKVEKNGFKLASLVLELPMGVLTITQMDTLELHIILIGSAKLLD